MVCSLIFTFQSIIKQSLISCFNFFGFGYSAITQQLNLGYKWNAKVVRQKWLNQFVSFVDVYKEISIGNKINLYFPAERFDILIRQYFFLVFHNALLNFLSCPSFGVSRQGFLKHSQNCFYLLLPSSLKYYKIWAFNGIICQPNVHAIANISNSRWSFN